MKAVSFCGCLASKKKHQVVKVREKVMSWDKAQYEVE